MEYKVGDKVFFKIDIEGTGYIVDIVNNDFYVIATDMDEESRLWEQWHPAAKRDVAYNGAVVYASDYDVRDLA